LLYIVKKEICERNIDIARYLAGLDMRNKHGKHIDYIVENQDEYLNNDFLQSIALNINIPVNLNPNL
jgi:hypothetical protein